MVTTVALTITGCVLIFSRNYIQSHSKANKSKVELILESQKSTQGKGTDSQVSQYTFAGTFSHGESH